MSILLSAEEMNKILEYRAVTGYSKESVISLAKAAAIHAVQYLEEPCKEHPWKDSELYSGDDGKLTAYIGMKEVTRYFTHRRDCPDCMANIEKELGI